MREEAQMTKVDEKKLRSTIDASAWAREFSKVCPEVDEGLMIGWFANAMMNVFDYKDREHESAKYDRESLFDYLDNIDTIDDIAKGDDILYRDLVRKEHVKRFKHGQVDSGGSDCIIWIKKED